MPQYREAVGRSWADRLDLDVSVRHPSQITEPTRSKIADDHSIVGGNSRGRQSIRRRRARGDLDGRDVGCGG